MYGTISGQISFTKLQKHTQVPQHVLFFTNTNFWTCGLLVPSLDTGRKDLDEGNEGFEPRPELIGV